MKKRLFLVTGSPGVGKTTVVSSVVGALKLKGYSVGGMLSRDVKSDGSRIGFEILDLASERKGWLASITQQQGTPRVGRYHVNQEDLDSVGVRAILEANQNSDVVVVDEIGPMELSSDRFIEAVMKVVQGKKLAVCTIHWKIENCLMEAIRKREDAATFLVTYENRQTLPQIVVARSVEFLSGE